jgi:hypothetical protein
MNINWNGFIVNAIVVVFLVLIVNVIPHEIVLFHLTIILQMVSFMITIVMNNGFVTYTIGGHISR